MPCSYLSILKEKLSIPTICSGCPFSSSYLPFNYGLASRPAYLESSFQTWFPSYFLSLFLNFGFHDFFWSFEFCICTCFPSIWTFFSLRNLTWFISLNSWVDAHLPKPPNPLSHPLGMGRWQGMGWKESRYLWEKVGFDWCKLELWVNGEVSF